jgi:hypothetical protein
VFKAVERLIGDDSWRLVTQRFLPKFPQSRDSLLAACSPIATALRLMATISGGRAILIFSAVAFRHLLIE